LEKRPSSSRRAGRQGEGRLVDRAGGGVGELGERVKTRWSLARCRNGDRIALRGQRADRYGPHEKEQDTAMHGKYAISQKVVSLKGAFVWKTDILRT